MFKAYFTSVGGRGFGICYFWPLCVYMCVCACVYVCVRARTLSAGAGRAAASAAGCSSPSPRPALSGRCGTAPPSCSPPPPPRSPGASGSGSSGSSGGPIAERRVSLDAQDRTDLLTETTWKLLKRTRSFCSLAILCSSSIWSVSSLILLSSLLTLFASTDLFLHKHTHTHTHTHTHISQQLHYKVPFSIIFLPDHVYLWHLRSSYSVSY